MFKDSEPSSNTMVINKCNIDAYTCCLGTHFIVMEETRREAEVFGYKRARPKIIPIVTSATAYDDAVSGTIYILIFNESLYYGNKLDHSLVNPNQLCMYEKRYI